MDKESRTEIIAITAIVIAILFLVCWIEASGEVKRLNDFVACDKIHIEWNRNEAEMYKKMYEDLKSSKRL